MTTAAYRFNDPFGADALAGLVAAFGGEPAAEPLARALSALPQQPNTAAKAARLPLPGETFPLLTKNQSRLPGYGDVPEPSSSPLMDVVRPTSTAAAAPAQSQARPNAFADLIREYEQPAPARADAKPKPQNDPISRLIKGERQEAPPASLLWDVIRSAGTGLRSGAEGLAGLPEDAAHGLRWAAEQVGSWAGSPIDEDFIAGEGLTRGPETGEIHEATTGLVGESYRPKTTAGKYARTISEFLPGAVLPVGGAGRTAALASLPRNAIVGGVLPGAASEAAGQAAEGTENEGLARALAAITTGVGGGLLFGPKLPKTTANAQREKIVDAARRQDVHIPEAAMPDARTGGYVAGKLGQMPFLGSPLAKSAEKTVDQLGNRLDALASAKGATNYNAAINQTRDHLLDWTGNVSPAQMTQAYDAVDNIIAQANRTQTGRPRAQPTTPLSNTRQMYNDVAAELAEDTTTSAQTATRLVEEAITRPGGLTYNGLKRLRTDIGARLSGKITPEPGTSQPALSRLYGALTQDLELAVYRAGGAPALRAWERANDLTRVIKRRQDDIAKIVGVKGQNSAENIANRLLNLAGTKGSGDLALLRQAREAVDQAAGGPQAWDDIGAALIQRLGRDPSSATGAFSPDRFLTAMGKFEKEAADALFGWRTMKDLNDLRLISAAHRDLMRRGNPSGTGGVVALGQGMTALGGAGAASMATGSPAPLALLATIMGGGMATAGLLARSASRQKLINWARARNGALRSGTTAAVGSYLAASNELAPFVAMHSGQDEGEVARGLAGQPAGYQGGAFDDLIREYAR